MSRIETRPGSLLLILAVAGGDLLTKYLVQGRLDLHDRIPVAGDYVRLTLIYNPGAAFGMSLGSYSRPVFTVLAVAALVLLAVLLVRTPASERLRLFSLAVIMGGALGNVLNRLWIASGVVDWIDVGIGALRWPAFNLADAGITLGAVALAFSFWGEGRSERRREIQADSAR